MPISHAFISGKSDGGDATLVRPSDWNANHEFDLMPKVDNYGSVFEASSTSAVVTPGGGGLDAGVTAIALVYSRTRGANSITQANVTWTQRYTNNGTSSYFEVWTGVVAASPGATATAAFTGSAMNFVEVFQMPGAPAFTAATGLTSSTGTAALASPTTTSSLTVNDWCVWGCSANAPSSSYAAASHPYRVLSATGGAGRGGLFRAIGESFSVWSISSSSVAYFQAIVRLS